MPKVSVIIPTYNRAHLVGKAIESVLAQTYRDFEIIVVDDGSADATGEVVNSFQDSRISYIYQKNSGVASARNRGITASRGEYIALLDSDDVWLSEYLSLTVEQMEANPEVALVCSDCYICDKNLEERLHRKWRSSTFDTIKLHDAERHPLKYLLRSGCFISPQATLLRSSVLEKTGLFDETLLTHEDLEMFIRIVRDYPIKLVDLPLVEFRKHDNGLQSYHEQMYQDDIVVMDRALATCDLTKVEKRLATRRLSKAYYIWGWYYFYIKDYLSGRRRLRHAIRINPWSKGPYLFLARYYLFLTRRYLKRRIFPASSGRKRTVV